MRLLCDSSRTMHRNFARRTKLGLLLARIRRKLLFSTRKRRIGSQRVLRSVLSSAAPHGVTGVRASRSGGERVERVDPSNPRAAIGLTPVRRPAPAAQSERLTPFRSVRRDGLAGHPLEDPPFRSVRSASFGVRAGGSERGRCADSAACVRPRKRAWGSVRSPSGSGPSAAGRLVEGDCSRFVGRLRGGGPIAFARQVPRPSRGSGLCARSLDARSGPLERDRTQTGLAAFSCRSPPAPEASGALHSGARCAGSFTGARRT